MLVNGVASDVTIELYTRSLANPGVMPQQGAVISRLARLEEQNHIADFTVHIWPKRIAHDAVTAKTDPGAAILHQITRFREWTQGKGYSLPSFTTDDADSPLTGEEYATTALPSVTLAEYQGDTLWFVAPWTDGETQYSVSDRLDSLEQKTSPEVAQR
jgi:hypothetical protein